MRLPDLYLHRERILKTRGAGTPCQLANTPFDLFISDPYLINILFDKYILGTNLLYIQNAELIYNSQYFYE